MDQMAAANIALDVVSIIFSLLPVVYLLGNHRYRQERSNRYFLGVCVSNLLMIVGDLPDWLIQDASGPLRKIVLTLSSALFYTASAFVLYYFGRYIIEYPQKAKAAIRDFSLFLRGNMDSLKSKAPIPFEQELSHVEHYLALEQQRFQERLHVVYEIAARDFSIPPLTMQPIVENAVHHGVLKREEGGTVTVKTEETSDAYLVTVSDDGVGFRPDMRPPDDGRTHIGIENVRGRLSALCGGTLTLHSEAGVGTTALLAIPKREGTP